MRSRNGSQLSRAGADFSAMALTIRPPTESRPPPPTPSSSPAPAPAPHGPAEPSPFARLLQGIGRETERGEALIRKTLSASAAGRDFAPAELIALQAGIYRYSEVVDLGAKLVDRASSGVKTVVSGQ